MLTTRLLDAHLPYIKLDPVGYMELEVSNFTESMEDPTRCITLEWRTNDTATPVVITATVILRVQSMTPVFIQYEDQGQILTSYYPEWAFTGELLWDTNSSAQSATDTPVPIRGFLDTNADGELDAIWLQVVDGALTLPQPSGYMLW